MNKAQMNAKMVVIVKTVATICFCSYSFSPQKVSNSEAHNDVNYLKYKVELAKSELKEMYPDFVAKKNSRIAKTSKLLYEREV